MQDRPVSTGEDASVLLGAGGVSGERSLQICSAMSNTRTAPSELRARGNCTRTNRSVRHRTDTQCTFAYPLKRSRSGEIGRISNSFRRAAGPRPVPNECTQARSRTRAPQRGDGSAQVPDRDSFDGGCTGYPEYTGYPLTSRRDRPTLEPHFALGSPERGDGIPCWSAVANRVSPAPTEGSMARLIDKPQAGGPGLLLVAEIR